MDYNHFEIALTGLGREPSAAQWHGLLCGLICTGRPVNAGVWFDSARMFGGEHAVMSAETSAVLEIICESTRGQLDSTLLEFDLMLPDEDIALQSRASALKLWCEGFLYGLSAGGLDRNSQLSADTAEFIRDLAELCKISHDENESTENDEFYLLELVEYVRAGVLLLYDELNAGVDFNQAVH
ncbi:MAG TPA: UPF0149 family protein [Gammaproteobacteria bacterium]